MIGGDNIHMTMVDEGNYQWHLDTLN